MKYEIEVLNSILANNNLISSVSEDLFANADIKSLYQIIAGLHKSDGYISKETLSYYLQINKKVALLQYIKEPSMEFESALILLKKEYNKRLILDIVKYKDDIIKDDNLIFNTLTNALFSFKRDDLSYASFYIDKAFNNILEAEKNQFPIGIEKIDKTITLCPDRFITIGGASGSGKTAFTIFLINKLCEKYSDKLDILFISLEMSESRILSRFFSLLLSTPVDKLREKIEKKEVRDKLKSIISSYPLKILYSDVDIPKLNSLLSSHLSYCKSVNKVPIVFIDHIGEIAGLEEVSAKTHVDKITHTAKNFCKQGGIAFVLTQLRKDLLDQKNKQTSYRPNNSYIMNSQSVEARSDIILHLWRPEYHNIYSIYHETEDTIYEIDTKNSICIVNDKNRDNAKKDIWLDCDIATNNFQDISKNKIKVISMNS